MIDLHAHMWPAGLLAAVATGGTWYGWEGVVLRDGTAAVAMGDRLLRFPVPARDLASPEERLDRRLREGVHGEAVMPVGFIWGDHLPAAAAADLAIEVNEELAAAQAAAPDRLRGVALLPFVAPERVQGVLERALEGGLRAVAVPTNVRGLPLDDPRVLPAIELVLEASLPIVVHPTYLGGAAAERMSRYYLSNTIGAPLECTLAAMTLIHAGMLDRHPGARVLIVNGGGCLPYEIGRHSRRHRTRADARTMARPPEEYLPDLYYDSLVLDELSLRLMIDRIGIERIVIGTDHPFTTDVEGGSVAWVRSLTWLDPSAREMLLRGNAERFLGVPLLQETAAPERRRA